MSTPSRRWSALPFGLALALVGALGACSSDGGGGGGGDDLSYEDSPLNKVFQGLSSYADMSEEEMQALNDEQQRKVEEQVASCMAEQGFDYQPNVQNTGVSYSSEQYDGMEPLEYAQQYGYGMTTWEDTPSGQEMNAQGSDETYVDPNADVYEAMSDSERAAWDEALWGAPQEYDEDADAESYEYDWEASGCYGVAQHQVYEVDSPDAELIALQQDPQYSELFDAMNDMYSTLATNPKMSELNASWASCMADAGFAGFASVEDAQNSISEAQNALYEDIDEDAWADPDYTGPDMTELKKQEIATATADYTCRDKNDYDNQQLSIQFEIEQEFVDEHKDTIDSLLAAAQAARG